MLDAPSSPCKSALHRNNATSSRKQSHRAGQSSIDADEMRGRQHFPSKKSPPTPGKENFPVMFDANAKYGALMSQQRSLAGEAGSPNKKSKIRARSVSPNKGFRLRNKTPAAADVVQQPARSASEIDYEFVSMLSDMQVPNALMHKLMRLDVRVKDSMLKGQATLSLSALQQSASTKQRIPLSERFSRSKSTLTLTELDLDSAPLSPPDRSGAYMRQASSASSSAQSECSDGSSLGGQSKAAFPSRSNASMESFRSLAPSLAKEGGGHANAATAGYFATLLKANDSAHLDVGKVKQMRVVLAAESPAWLVEFFGQGGYRAMVVRLQELVQMEWREEQHDDQLLHELLRCFVVLASTQCGRQTLTSASPTPFVELCDLLYSEKKPGDLSTRKLLLDMLLLLPDLPPCRQSSQVNLTRVSSGLLSDTPHSNNFGLLLTLLHNQRDPAQEAVVDFITASHTPRPFKTWVTEMLNVSRDYFWIFCHSSNRFWDLTGVNVDEAQGPKVPGGMTGGVEFEAMSYLTAHFRLLNKVAEHLLQADGDRNGKAYLFHSLLFNSGFERALAISRKASQTYYQALHLEMARYFALARRAGFRLPVELEAWQTTPQLLSDAGTTMTKNSSDTSKGATEATTTTTTTTAVAAPMISLDLDSSLIGSITAAKPTVNTAPRGAATNGTVSKAVRKWEQRSTTVERKPFMIDDTAFSWV